jgi:hypothetical protein
VVGNVEAAALKNNRGRLEQTPRRVVTLGTDGHRLVGKRLFLLEVAETFGALVFIDRQHNTSMIQQTLFYVAIYFSAMASIRQLLGRRAIDIFPPQAYNPK